MILPARTAPPRCDGDAWQPKLPMDDGGDDDDCVCHASRMSTGACCPVSQLLHSLLYTCAAVRGSRRLPPAVEENQGLPPQRLLLLFLLPPLLPAVRLMRKRRLLLLLLARDQPSVTDHFPQSARPPLSFALSATFAYSVTHVTCGRAIAVVDR